ncbi:MAG: hypothetical protein RML40_03580 [Bacteroidota bacterium]|nr:hypothetical protein [Candidatus Kapabacteria bacterium]MDW8219592.1 hypothetical protein [Bacteroidota bacterium]
MEYFDAAEEIYESIQRFMIENNGACPTRVYLSPTLFQWLTQIRREEIALRGQDPSTLDLSVFPTEFCSPNVVIDEQLSDFEIITE